MIVKFSEDFPYKIKIFKKDNPKLFKKFSKQITIFTMNPNHPSLRTHKLQGKLKNLWSISINMKYRAVYVLLDKDTAMFTDIGKHSDIYK